MKKVTYCTDPKSSGSTILVEGVRHALLHTHTHTNPAVC